MTFKTLLFLFSVLASSALSAQNDFGLWLKHDLTYSLNKKVKLELDFQARFDRNVTRNKELFTTPSIQWEVHKFIKLGSEYRLTYFPSTAFDNGKPISQRITLDFEFQNIEKLWNKKSDLGMSLRIAGTSEHRKYARGDNYIRTRLKVDYNIPKTKLKPEFSAELFYHFNDQVSYSFTEVRTYNSFNKTRFKLGLEYPIGLKHKIALFGQYQHAFLAKINDFIMGIGYSYDINKKAKVN
ncbi:MAG: DUF2490 domain-containing protein [Crocinitomicaceae bacterium]